jgi:hypothetical protein
MRPLDLTTQRPRRATDTFAGGIVFLARTIDKVRAQLPGGVLGPYLVTSEEFQTMSAALFRRLDINEASSANSSARQATNVRSSIGFSHVRRPRRSRKGTNASAAFASNTSTMKRSVT